MKTKLQVLEETFFDVRKEKIEDGENSEWYIVANGERITRVSERYELVKNENLVKPFVDRFGAEALTSFSRQGNRFSYKFETGRTMEITKGDILKEQILIQNSYDKTRSFSFMFGAFRMVCSNGLYTGQSVINFKKIHMGEIPVADIVYRVLSSYDDNNFTLWREFQKTRIAYQEQLDLAGKFSAFEERGEEEKEESDDEIVYGYGRPRNAHFYNALIRLNAKRALQPLLTGKEDEIRAPKNGWGLFNTLNTAIARSIRQKDMARIVLANQRAEEYVAQLLN